MARTLFILARALVWSTLLVAFGLVFLPARLLEATGLRTGRPIGAVEILAIAAVIGGGILMLASVLTFVFIGRGTAAPFDPPRGLVTRGPFAVVRNPIYIGAVGSMLGAALYYRAWPLAAYALALAVGFHVLVIFYEEPTLRRSFGAAYEEYCRQVRRWLPRWP